MNRRKLKDYIFLAIFTVVFSVFVFSAEARNVTVTQKAALTKHRSANPNSEFVSNSFSDLDKSFSMPSFSLPKEKGKFSKHSSISEESSFSSKQSFRQPAKSGKFTKTSFSIHDDAEFSSPPSPRPRQHQSEFSTKK